MKRISQFYCINCRVALTTHISESGVASTSPFARSIKSNGPARNSQEANLENATWLFVKLRPDVLVFFPPHGSHLPTEPSIRSSTHRPATIYTAQATRLPDTLYPMDSIGHLFLPSFSPFFFFHRVMGFYGVRRSVA